ncbi:MAG: hypothetical protein ACT4QF_25145 [Sporichthyaceae bacterium]
MAGKSAMADVVPLRAQTPGADAPFRTPAIFDDADGPGRLAVRWQPDGTVAITVADGRGVAVPTEFRMAAADVLDFVRVLVEGLNEPGPVRLGPPAQVLPLTPRPSSS